MLNNDKYLNDNVRIEKEIIINEKIEKTWRRWTTSDGLKTFFGKDNFIELKLNGSFEIYFLTDNEVGNKGSEGCKIISYLTNTMLSFTWNVPPQFEKLRKENFRNWVVIFFEKINDNETMVKLCHCGWPDGDEYKIVFNYFDKAWDMVLQLLKKSSEQ